MNLLHRIICNLDPHLADIDRANREFARALNTRHLPQLHPVQERTRLQKVALDRQKQQNRASYKLPPYLKSPN
jgi:exonuclease VII small subunit